MANPMSSTLITLFGVPTRDEMVIGPIYSDALGSCLVIDTGPHHACTYHCVYCDPTRLDGCSISPCCRLSPYELYWSVEKKLEQCERQRVSPRWVVFAPTGDPALDSNLALEIRLLRELGCKTALISNGSLLWNPNVQENLLFADYVCLKIDTVREQTWRLLNRPHQRLHFDLVLQGIEEFARASQGVIATESVLFNDINDTREEVKGLGEYLATLHGRCAYVTLPTPLLKGPPVGEDVADGLLDTIPGARIRSLSLAGEFIAAVDRVTQTPPLQ
jgi:wyosine [tRNA(Phe)-imidazoG37] synthetase (radical SAM superfamily)